MDALAQFKLDGKNVLLVEDMIDTGNTMKSTIETLQEKFELKSLNSRRFVILLLKY